MLETPKHTDTDIKHLLKDQRDRVDSIYKTIGGLILFCCCGTLGWAGTNIINQKNDIIELKGRADKTDAVFNLEHEEGARRLEDLTKKLDKLENEVNHKLESIEIKLDKVIDRKGP